MTASDHSLVALGNALDGRVRMGFTTEPEVAASSVEGQQVDRRAGASSDDTEGSIGGLALLRAGNGSHQRGESEEGRELHIERE